MSKVKDLTGQKYNKLTVIKRTESRITKSGNKITQWLCQCDCGNMTVVDSNKITSGRTKSYGCEKNTIGDKLRKDLTGKKFRKLTAIKINKVENHITWWECKCECGNNIVAQASRLICGNTKSCGCLSKEIASQIHLKDLTGMKFNMLTVLSRAENHGTKTRWKCICDCGNECICYSDVLLNANQISCGCSSLSKGEIQIEKYLNLHNVKYEKQKKFDDLRGIGNGSLSYDFYLPQYNMLCEFQGLQHRQKTGYFGGEEKFARQIEHDRRKREYAEDNGYKLLEIWYQDYKNIDKILNNELQKEVG